MKFIRDLIEEKSRSLQERHLRQDQQEMLRQDAEPEMPPEMPSEMPPEMPSEMPGTQPEMQMPEQAEEVPVARLPDATAKMEDSEPDRRRPAGRPRYDLDELNDLRRALASSDDAPVAADEPDDDEMMEATMDEADAFGGIEEAVEDMVGSADPAEDPVPEETQVAEAAPEEAEIAADEPVAEAPVAEEPAAEEPAAEETVADISAMAAPDDIPDVAPTPLEVPRSAAGRSNRQSGRVKTRILGFSSPNSAGTDPFEKASETAASTMTQFPVGWLAVVEGPGRGAAFTIFDGVAQIGRGEDQAVRLDFGDNSISRQNHAAIAYDNEQKAFFLGHGGKANLVRINGRPVLSTEELHTGDTVRIGETTLRFVALCGETFSWEQDQEGDVRNASAG